jgi:flagellar basal-body rod protein FlgG
MIRALYSSSAGMNSQQMNLDVIANNLANVNTTGFKKSKIEFEDLLYQSTRTAGADQGAGNKLPTGVQIGQGSKAVATEKVFTQGDLTNTGEQMDVAIQGQGFFQIQLPDGSLGYTRDGAFKLREDGTVVTSDGLPVLSGFQPIPSGTTEISISTNGVVTTKSGNTTTGTFQTQLARFANPAGLTSQGGNLFVESESSGTAELGNPGEKGFGTMQQNFLEMSNVKVVEEMVNLIVAQRAYEVNSKAVQAADEMMQLSNNLRR